MPVATDVDNPLLEGPLAIDVIADFGPWSTVCGTVWLRDGALCTVLPSREREFILESAPVIGNGVVTAKSSAGSVTIRPLRLADRSLFATPKPRNMCELKLRAWQALDLYGTH